MTEEMKTKMLGLAKIATINGAIEEATIINEFVLTVETREKILVEALDQLRLHFQNESTPNSLEFIEATLKKLGYK